MNSVIEPWVATEFQQHDKETSMIEHGDLKKAGTGEIKRFLAFSLGQEHYAIPLLAVKEVIAMPDFTPVPYTPPHFLGIINLRGQVISVIDMRLKFGIKAEKTHESAVIICDFNSVSVGIVVNSVNSVLSLNEEAISPTPEIESTKKTDHIIGVTKQGPKLVILLDIAKALDMDDLNAIKNAEKKRA